MRFLAEAGLSQEGAQACELALVEACNNAVQYASGEARQRPVLLDVLCENGWVELRVTDHTKGFALPSEIELPDPESESGRGLFLIRTLMDEVDYLRGSSSNCMTLRKVLSPSSALLVSSPAANWEQMRIKLNESEQIITDMAEELSFCYEGLSAIFRCSSELGGNKSRKEFSDKLLHELAQIASADWFVLRLVSPDGAHLSVLSASDSDFDLEPLALSETGAAEAEAALKQQDVWLDGQRAWAAHDPLRRARPAMAGLVHPFYIGRELVGTLAIGRNSSSDPFTAVHANVVHTFSDFLAIQVANARLQEAHVKSKVLSRELEIARNIQRSLLPKAPAGFPPAQFAAYCESAELVGGDFYDVVKFDDRSVLLIIADVMGKGIPAAMFAAILRSVLRVAPEWINEPAVLLSRVNRLLFSDLSDVEMFITAQLVFVDAVSKRVVSSGAGHCPFFLSPGRGEPAKLIWSDGVPLGVLPATEYAARVEEIHDGFQLLLYTDGLTEARTGGGDFFGQERLFHWFQENAGRPASALRDELAARLERFQDGANLKDDQTFMIFGG